MEHVPAAQRHSPLEPDSLLHPAGRRYRPDVPLRHPGGQRPPGDAVWGLPVLLWGE